MKKLFFILFAVAAFSFSASDQNDNGLIGKARGAAHECLQDAPNGWDVNGYSETVGICFVEGFLTKVTFYAEFRCHSEVCPKVAAQLLAEVFIDCEGNVVDVTCY